MNTSLKAHMVAILREEKGLLTQFFLASVGRTVLSVAAILMIREFLSGVLDEQHGMAHTFAVSVGTTAALWVVASLLVAAFLGSSLLTYSNQVVQQRLVKRVELKVMERLIRHLLTLSVRFFERNSHGDIIQAVRHDITRLRIVTVAVAKLCLDGMLAVGLLASALWLSPRLTMWALVVLPAAVLPVFLIARRTLAHSYKVRRRGHVLYDMIMQILHGIRVIKIYRGEAAEAHGAVERARHYFDELVEQTRIRSVADVVVDSIAGFSLVTVVIVGGFQVMNDTLTWPALLAFLMAVRALHRPLNNMNVSFMSIQSNGAAVERIVELLNEQSDLPEASEPAPLPSAPAEIQFDNVSFAYDDSLALHRISFQVAAGETIGIAGPSGAGKSTLLNLVARFYDVTSGVVRFDGCDLRQFSLADVYDKLAIVTQQPFLFSTSVRENIRCGRPDATEDEVEQAARAAEIHDEILEWPSGYDTPVGHGGRGISEGQAQRINVARALLKNAPVLLLDEATSSLDSIAEANMQRAIERLMVGRTTFVVAHRLSTLRNANRILVLDQGSCVGIGTHEQLVHSCALYREIWETQRLGEVNDHPAHS